MADSPHELTLALQQSIAKSRKEFVVAASAARPRLHKFCTRMCGSTLDGEDVVQEVLADAFFNLSTLKDATRFEAWLFRIAYNKSIDFLRREKAREHEVPFAEDHDAPPAPENDAEPDIPIDAALITLVGELPPKERAAVVLKDVLDYSLTEVADVVDSTVGGVKAALHRARTKLRSATAAPIATKLDAEQRRLFDAYAECFNQRDWDGLRLLVRADARLEIVGENRGTMSGLGASYHTNYSKLPWEWKLEAGVIDHTPVIVHWRRYGDAWRAQSAIRLWYENGQVVGIRDYIHVDYLLLEEGHPAVS